MVETARKMSGVGKRHRTIGETEDFGPQIAEIRKADFGSAADVAARYIIVCLSGLALALATSEFFYIGWIVVYMVTNLIYRYALLSCTAPVSRGMYSTLIAMNVVTSSTYAFMPIYLWLTTENTALQSIAICGIIGHALFNLARHNSRTAIATWDSVSMVLTSCIITGQLVWSHETLADQFVIVFGAIAVTGYFIYAQYTAIADRQALRASREEAIHSQKLSAMGQVTAGVAHDFNNLLTVIQGNIELADLTRDPIERRELLAEASETTKKAAHVVAQMQAYVRKSPFRIQALNLDSYLTRFNNKILRYLPDNIRFEVQMDEPDLGIEVDEALLETGLLNLVLNARDAIGRDSGAVWLTVTEHNEQNWPGPPPRAEGPFIRFDLRDTGSGIPEEVLGMVTDPYFTTKPVGSGSGLGLSMVSGFADQVGGAFHLQNHSQGGVEACLLLPKVPSLK